ncbi:MAG TPA: alpha/beta hydrolase [Gemmatimonadales bacterium]|nr:alpha/beta hydrolase [Gemmatimonadales bacterium]
MTRILKKRSGWRWWAKAALLGLLVVAVTALAGGAVVTGVAGRRAAAEYPPEGRLVGVGDARIHVLERGAGPPVVMLHGNPGFVEEFTPLAAALAPDFRAIAVDRPGHGHSDRPSNAGTGPLEQVALIRAALDSLGVRRPVLVGHSWGGGLSLVYALEHPDEVAGLVLIGSRAFPLDDRDPIYGLVRTPLIGAFLRHTLLLPLSRSMVEDGLAAAYSPEPPQPAHIAAAGAVWTRPGQVAATVWDTRNLNRALTTYATRYGELRMPVEILVGERDGLRPESERLHLEIDGANMVIFDAGGHEVHRTRAGEVRRAVERVAGRVTGAP